MDLNQRCCRLCFEISDDVTVNVFESFQNSSIASILTKHFWFKVLESDGFSEWLCQICWIQTKTFHNFYKRLERLHQNRRRNEQTKLIKINVKKSLTEEVPKPGRCDETKDTTDTTDDIEICKEEILEYNDDANGQGGYQGDSETSDEDPTCYEQQPDTPHCPSLSDKDEQDAQIREFFRMKCELCTTDVKFEKFLDAKKHYRDVHKIKGYLMCCSCGKKLRHRFRLLDHIRFHVNPNAYQCAHCDKAVHCKKILKAHLKTHFTQSHRCSTCSKSFCSASTLRHHVNHKHRTKTQNESLPCDKCSKTFKNISSLNSHHLSVHLTQQVVCEICARLFKGQTTLRNHVANKHPTTTQPEVICDICGASFKLQIYLKRHLKLHEEWKRKVDPVKCQTCDKMVKNERALALHINFAHSEKLHQCTMCPKSFKTANRLKEHVAVHTGEDLYTCRYCEKKSKSNANMCKHMKNAHFDDWARDRPGRLKLIKKSGVE